MGRLIEPRTTSDLKEGESSPQSVNESSLFATENVADGRQEACISHILANLGLQTPNLSSAAREELQIAAKTIQKLGLSSAKPSLVLQKVLEMRQRSLDLEAKQGEADTLLSLLKSQTAHLNRQSELLETIQGAFIEQTAQSKKNAAERASLQEALASKLVQYKIEINQLNTALEQRGYKPELQQTEVYKNFQLISAKYREAEKLQFELSKYRDLPANMEAAEKVYADVYGKFEDVNARFESMLAGV